jgi:hypothetical protein
MHCAAQNKEVKLLIDTTITIMRDNAVNASKVDWNKARETALQQARSIENPYELITVMCYLYQCINDFHGVLLLQRQYIPLAE